MRVLAHITVPVEQGNRALQDGSLPKLMQQTAEQWHPEAMYFGPSNGCRSAYIIFDMASQADMPAFSEPFFEQLNAQVELIPVMTAEDLQQGLGRLRR